MKTPIRYAGGKTKAIKHITPFVSDYDKIVSPFLGGGSLEVHWASHGKKVHGSDVFDILTNFWNQLLANPTALAEELSKITPDSNTYKKVKESLMVTPQVQEMLKGWKTDFYKRSPEPLSDLTLAAYYFFNHNCSYGPGFLGWASKIYLDQKKWNKKVAKIKDFSCPNLSVQEADFGSVIEDNPNDFLYLDPPYLLSEDRSNKMFAGIYPMRNIPVHHSGFEHEKLRDLLHKHNGDFVMSYNDCDEIRDWYSDFDFYYPKWHYSMSLGETRIGKHREKHGENKKDSHEILIVKKASKK